MEISLVFIIGLYFSASLYLMMSNYFVRIVLGLALLSNGVNLLIFGAGRLVRETPPIIPKHAMLLDAQAANPLPQALILTAIVISFSLFAFMLVLAYRTFQINDSDDISQHRLAEPIHPARPPTDY